MLYNKGELITIRKDLECEKRYYMLNGNKKRQLYDIAIQYMLQYAGQKAIIIDYLRGKYIIKFFNNETSDEYWTDEMFEETLINDNTLLIDIINKNMAFT